MKYKNLLWKTMRMRIEARKDIGASKSLVTRKFKHIVSEVMHKENKE